MQGLSCSKQDQSALPILDSVLHGSTLFSKVGLIKAYHQIPVEEDDIPKTVITTQCSTIYTHAIRITQRGTDVSSDHRPGATRIAILLRIPERRPCLPPQLSANMRIIYGHCFVAWRNMVSLSTSRNVNLAFHN